MAHPTQPRQILNGVRAALRTKHLVMHRNPYPAFTTLTRLVEAF
jgi:hypothetical protein